MRWMTRVAIAFVAVVVLAAPARAQEFTDVWPGLVARTERAYVHGDASEMIAVRTTLQELLHTGLSGAQRSLARYTVAYLNWRLFTVPDSVPADERDDLLDEAVTLLREDLEDDDGNAESHALLASVYGLQIGSSRWRGIFLGRRASAASDRALELAPGNPRVLLLGGVGKLNTPRMFGGGEDVAESLLRRAVAAFRTEPPGRPWPRWGRIDAHAWLGQVMARRGDFDAARRHYRDALAIEPAFGWVRGVLLPALDREGRP
ncbi:MAG: tetratricopeptide repeat protein [Acidobacteria bacterium]|nr:tetratricopeptide repeat protein [Acidobacteriota bacterium]